MKSSRKLSAKALRITPEKEVLLPAILSILGFADAMYLTVRHYLGITANCFISSGCEEVLTSQYATIADVPVALIGSLYYLTLFFLFVAYLDTKRLLLLRITSNIVAGGFVTSLGFMYLQFFVIKSLCLYCTASALITTALFALGLTYRKKLASSPEKTV